MESLTPLPGYHEILASIVGLLETARRASARSVNAVMTTTYWEIGRRIVEGEQHGTGRADYGTELLKRLGADLANRFGRGFSWRNLYQMRGFYLAYAQILQTPSAKSEPHRERVATPGKLQAPPEAVTAVPAKMGGQSLNGIAQTASARSEGAVRRFPLPWSHYVKLLAVEDPEARAFYEVEALRGGWSVRQLDRQIGSKFYERTLLSRAKAAMLCQGGKPLPPDAISPEEEIKDPFVLEFLGLKDEYSETDLEEALILHLEHFLLELGGNFAFLGRQRRLRIGDEWYRIDLLFFHRRLRCLVVIDLKLAKFTPADVGQMHLYLNYAREHWTQEHENPPVGLILCAQKDEAVAHYALEGLPNKVLASEYKMALPDEQVLVAELKRTQAALTLKGIPP
jgi:predicted nuclease of restriction endonuclease-like (RecB) superfamily